MLLETAAKVCGIISFIVVLGLVNTALQYTNKRDRGNIFNRAKDFLVRRVAPYKGFGWLRKPGILTRLLLVAALALGLFNLIVNF